MVQENFPAPPHFPVLFHKAASYNVCRSVRVAAAEQFLLISTWCVASQQPLQFCITLLFTVLNTTVMENSRNSHEYFQLLCRLLNYAFMSNCPLPTAETLLNNEITWLKKIRVSGGEDT
jgi:ubiquitin carboxyl-terminal hydrolase 9/24